MKKSNNLAFFFASIYALVGINAINFAINLKYSAIFSEYFFKYLPALSDGNIYTIFDIKLIGDPRPRYFSTLLEFLNLFIRKLLFNYDVFIPTISINWIIYPATIFFLYLATIQIHKNRVIALTTSLLFACSPAALDMLCNFYIPSKPLILFFSAITIFLLAKFFEFKNNELTSQIFNLILVSVILLLGFLSDETSFFIYLLIISIFIKKIYILNRDQIILIVFILLLPLFFYIAIANITVNIEVAPFITVTGNFFSLVLKGIHSSIFEINDNLNYSFNFQAPLSLLEVTLSKFFITNVIVSGSWATHINPGFFSFSDLEKIQLNFSLAFCLLLYFNLTNRNKSFFCWVCIGFIIFCILQSIMLGPLTTYLKDVNYYAGMSSIWMSILIGILIGGTNKNFLIIPSKIFLILIVLNSLVNFHSTALRNPFLSNPSPKYTDISRLISLVKNNDFMSHASGIPEFPNRMFSYAFEMEIMKRSSLKEKIDFEPYKNFLKSPLSFLPVIGIQDTLLLQSDNFPRNGNTLYLAVGDKLFASDINMILLNRKIRGASGPWRFIRQFDANGNFVDRVWFEGITRQWTLSGKITYINDLFCFDFSNGARECHKFYLADDNIYLGFGLKDEVTTFFKIIN